MDRDTLFEEIRTKLREAQEDHVDDPWLYQDEDLIMACRSAIRNLRAIGISLTANLSLTGAFDVDPSEQEGVLIALKVVMDLLRGDLTQKLHKGEIGVSVRSVLDSYSTTEAAKGLAKAAAEYKLDYDSLLTIVLSNATDSASAVYGQQGTSVT